ncbi:MAG: phosphodiester glycosidase family protein [Candidatus Caenarcaniphilales bacterium]|nr:phosphodiester glycosidase family protein [Candidatus Caenarcaniphilales bacterium]
MFINSSHQNLIFKRVILFHLFVICSLLPINQAHSKITNVEQETISPGLIHHRFIKYTSHGPVKINILEIDTSKGFTVKPSLAQSNSIWGKATVSNIVSNKGAIAGINANYFNSRGMPIGSLAIDKEWITGPVYNRASVSIDEAGNLGFARPSVVGKLSVLKKSSKGSAISAYYRSKKKNIPAQLILSVDNINQPDSLAGKDGVSFYNHWWQDKLSCGEGRACVLVDRNGIVRTKISNYESTTLVQPTRNDYVLTSLNSSNLEGVEIGDKLVLNWYSTPDWSSMSHVVGGGPYLLRKGQIIIDEVREGFTKRSGINKTAPRTAIGMTKPGRLIWLTADGRQKDSVGMNLQELASLMKEIGVVEAINMDGGGSTTMVLEGSVVNSPSERSGLRSVSTALLLFEPGHKASPWEGSIHGLGGP